MEIAVTEKGTKRLSGKDREKKRQRKIQRDGDPGKKE